MKEVTLSDHTADMALRAATKREEEYSAALASYHTAISSREANLKSLKISVREAWNNRKIFLSIIYLAKLGLGYLAEKPPVPELRAAGRDEIVWASGKEGERKVFSYFADRLSDEWTLFSGYRNVKGEIDQILVGPSGVFAIEIKYHNGVVHCDGDRWWSDKYDRYGNMVEIKEIKDKKGRCPSKQINEPADLLQKFLAKRTGISRVYRCIVLSHDSSRLGTLNNVLVDFVVDINSFEVQKLFALSAIALEAKQIERIIHAISKDHEYYDKPRVPSVQSLSVS